MDLKTWRKGYEHCINNAIQLREDGKLLMENKSYGHAYFSFYTALEELGKAYIILSHLSEPQPEILKRMLMDHEQKRTLMIFDGFKHKIKDLNLPKDYLRQIYESGESYELWMGKKLNQKLEIWDKRNYGIYVSLNKSSTNWITPVKVSQQDSDSLLKVLDEQFEGYRNTLDFLKRRELL